MAVVVKAIRHGQTASDVRQGLPAAEIIAEYSTRRKVEGNKTDGGPSIGCLLRRAQTKATPLCAPLLSLP